MYECSFCIVIFPNDVLLAMLHETSMEFDLKLKLLSLNYFYVVYFYYLVVIIDRLTLHLEPAMQSLQALKESESPKIQRRQRS